ncbi:MAG: hypothetical protein MSS60_04875 [Clostridiales bacterium]|nr:hypothetical protein [Clostridiales bacterium]
MTDIEILERANDYVGIHYVNGVEDAYISPCLLKAIKNGIAALREQEERENQNPLTLEELKLHLSKRHPHEIEPLYIVFDPPMPVDYAPRWRDAYNLSSLVAHDAENYGKRWKAYRSKPKEGS